MNSHTKTLFLLFPLIVALSLLGLIFEITKHNANLSLRDKVTESTLPVGLARTALEYIRSGDFNSLSNLMDEGVGLRVFPYYSDGSAQWSSGRTLYKADVRDFFLEKRISTWGFQDGSGQPIQLTNADYYQKYIYNADFLKLGTESINSTLAKGSTPSLDEDLNTLFKTQILAGMKVQYVEYYIPGRDPKYEGMDWQSLALIFMRIDNAWKLVSLMHNQWTI
jgi:hypothetical protein